jgi:hypothetical protein
METNGTAMIPSKSTCFSLLFAGSGSESIVTEATTGLLYQPRMLDVGGMLGRGNPVQLCPPQIPHDLTQARARAAAVGNRRPA